MRKGWNTRSQPCKEAFYREVMKRLLQKDRSKSEWWVYKMAVGPVMMFGLVLAELKGLFPWEWPALIRNDHIRGTAQADCFGDEAEQVCTWMLTVKSPGTRRRGRPHRTFIDVVMEDMLVWQKRLGWDDLFFFLVQKEEENVTLYNGYFETLVFVENPTLSSDRCH